MKIRILSITLGLSLFCAGTVQGQRVRLRTTADSLAYYIGIDFARHMQQMYGQLPIDFQAETAMSAIEGVFNPKKASGMPETEEAQAYLNEYFTVRLPAENLRASEVWLAEVERTTTGIQRTESGLLYLIVEPGSSVRATADEDRVEVNYEGRLRDGTLFDSSHERGETATFTLKEVISGWREGMKLVGKGGTIRLWIPPTLAYGTSAGPPNILPNSAICFEVELIDVIPAE
jgi:FKBP-type peptidyl-prolyl cis-trans isomerase